MEAYARSRGRASRRSTFPTPNPRFAATGEDVTVDVETAGMLRVRAFSDQFARVVMGFPVPIQFVRSKQSFIAAFGKDVGLLWNASDDWYARVTATSRPSTDLLAVLFHEFAHAKADDHLSEKFHLAICEVAARYADEVARGRILWGIECWGT